MRKTAHISVFVFSLTLALILGVLDHETHTISALFLNKGNIFALVIYTLLFMTVSYTGIWIYNRTKIVLKNKPTD